MSKSLSQYKTLGVINRTPNSFSDHGLSLNHTHFHSQLSSFLKDTSIIIDVGFESTAPMNSAITIDEELTRFQDFLEASKDFDFNERFISFDTYKVENFSIMYEAFKQLHPQAHIIFNDVSGILDEELKNTLLKYKDKNFYYIYTFSHIPERAYTLKHMSFLNNELDILDQTANAFVKALKWFKDIGMSEQLILDPGFGFSKSYEQNWRLIDHFSLLSESLLKSQVSNTLLIGLSKKSFLKNNLEASGKIISEIELENLHLRAINSIKNQSKHQLLFRVHNPFIL
jgi:dihydropteroate synthase